MLDVSTKDGVWLFYDGECPVCNSVADYLRIKKQYGSLHLIDARDPQNSELVQSVNERGFDLDEGVVIVHEGRFFYGQDALKFMARHSPTRNIFSLICKSVFWSENIARLVYPWLKGIRNWLLHRRRIERIDNLRLCEEPIFQSVFGESWEKIAPVIGRRYANRPYTEDKVTVEGTLDVMCSGPVRVLAPLLWLLRTVPPMNVKEVPVSVNFHSNPHSKEVAFDRVFRFEKRGAYYLRTRMIQIKANDIMEILNYGICWLATCSWINDKVVMRHKGYALKLMGHSVVLPITFLFGEVEGEETPIDDETFHTRVTIKHPWFGVVYEYKGLLKITSDR